MGVSPVVVETYSVRFSVGAPFQRITDTRRSMCHSAYEVATYAYDLERPLRSMMPVFAAQCGRAKHERCSMTPDEVTQAVYGAITGSGESIIEGTVVAVLPMLWFALMAIHLARPYILRVVTKFSLRIGADL